MEARRRRSRHQLSSTSTSSTLSCGFGVGGESDSSTGSQDGSSNSNSNSNSTSSNSDGTSSMLSTPRAPLLGSKISSRNAIDIRDDEVHTDMLPQHLPHHHEHKKDDDNDMGAPSSASSSISPQSNQHSYKPPTLRLSEMQSAQDPAEVAEEQILKAIDRLEDEWDEHTYEDIVPLEIKLALEERIFGWSHLVSAFIGYTLFTASAFILTYAGLWHFTQSPLGHWIRGPLSLVAAMTTFRMVRRRRKVWFRAAYGTKAYLELEPQRRKEVQEADKSSWLGRIRKLQRQRKVARQLQKAETNFTKHHERRLLRAQSLGMAEYSSNTNSNNTSTDTSNTNKNSTYKLRRRLSFRTDPFPVMQSIQRDQITFSDGLIQRMPYSHGGFFGAAPFLLANPHWISILRLLMPDVYVEISRRVKSAPLPRLIHWAENNPVVAAYGTAHELEYNGHIPNLEWDIFLDPALVKRVQVVLREQQKFLQAVAPSEIMMACDDPKTSPRRAREQFYKESSMTNKQRHILRYYEKELNQRVRTLVDKMLIAHGSLTQLALEQTGFCKHYNYSRVKRTRRTLGGGIYARQWMATYAESLRIGVFNQHTTTAGTPYDASSTATCDTSSSGSDISSPTFTLPAMTTLYGVNQTLCPNTSLAESVAIVKEIAKTEDPIGLVLDLKSRHVPVSQVHTTTVLHCCGMRFCLTLRFPHAPHSLHFHTTQKEVLGCVIDCLREAGARVEGVGTFVVDDIRDVSPYCAEPVKEILFFHSAGDMQQACHNGRIRNGDTVFFNAGSLLWKSNQMHDGGAILQRAINTCYCAFDPEEEKRSYCLLPFAHTSKIDEPTPKGVSRQSSTIEAYKERFNLSIGMYVQEFAIDEAAVNLFVRLVNESPHVYDLGLSWGGVNGITLRGMQPHRFTSTDGFWNQRYAGATWDTLMSPPLPPLL
jgi:hypothetical protein